MLTERLPHRYNLGCLIWSSVSEPIIITSCYTRHTPMHASTVRSCGWVTISLKAERLKHVFLSVRF